jgi:hypothetical protein
MHVRFADAELARACSSELGWAGSSCSTAFVAPSQGALVFSYVMGRAQRGENLTSKDPRNETT